MTISEAIQANASAWTPASPAVEEAVSSLHAQLGFDLPADYLAFLRLSNGGYGDLPVQPWCFDRLCAAEELAEFNRDYQVPTYCPGFLGIGSSGGGEMFAFDMRGPQPWPVVIVPFIGMAPEEALLVAPDFCSFVRLFGQQSRDA